MLAELLFVVALGVGTVIYNIRQAESDKKREELAAIERQRQLSLSPLEFLREFDRLRRAAERRREDAIRLSSSDTRSNTRRRYRYNAKERSRVSSAGSIYVVPARLRRYGDYYTPYSYGRETEYLNEKIRNIFSTYEYSWDFGDKPAVFKVGFTTRSVQKRIEELNSSSGNYERWEFNGRWIMYYRVDYNVEEFEQMVHERLKEKLILGELFYDNFFNIHDAICETTGGAHTMIAGGSRTTL